MFWALVNSQDMLSFGSFPSRCEPPDCKLAFSYYSSLTSWTDHSSEGAVWGCAEGWRREGTTPTSLHCYQKHPESWGDCAWSNLQGECWDEQSRWMVPYDLVIFMQWMGKTLLCSLTPQMTVFKDLLCLFVIGVGKSSLLLRFADNTFSGEWFVSLNKWNAPGLLQCCWLVRNLCLPTDSCAGNTLCF